MPLVLTLVTFLAGQAPSRSRHDYLSFYHRELDFELGRASLGTSTTPLSDVTLATRYRRHAF